MFTNQLGMSTWKHLIAAFLNSFEFSIQTFLVGKYSLGHASSLVVPICFKFQSLSHPMRFPPEYITTHTFSHPTVWIMFISNYYLVSFFGLQCTSRVGTVLVSCSFMKPTKVIYTISIMFACHKVKLSLSSLQTINHWTSTQGCIQLYCRLLRAGK